MVEEQKIKKAAWGIQYAVTGFWLLIAFCGWAIALSGLAALQNYVNATSINSHSTTDWAVQANYPNLPAGRLLRFDWFVVFLELTVLFIVVLATATRVLAQTRPLLVGYLAVASVLTILSTDRTYNIGHFRSLAGNNVYHASRAAFAGFLISATANFALIYMLGLQPEEI